MLARHLSVWRQNATRIALFCTFMLLLIGIAANAQNAEPPLPLYALPDARANRVYTSSTIAFAEDIRTMVAANMINHTATILMPADGKVLAEIPVGKDPRSAAFTLDNRRALVANRGDGTLSVIGIREEEVLATIPLGGGSPYGVVCSSNEVAYVSLETNDEVVVVDLVNNRVAARIPVPDAPAGLALWGEFLYVTHFWSGDLSLIYLPQARVVATTHTRTDTGLSQAVELDITRGIAYLPQTRSNAQNVNLTYDTTVFPVINVVDLRDLSLRRGERITLDTADRPVNMPFAAALDRFREFLYVANAGTNNVSVIDLNTGAARANIPVGANPRGILLNRDNTVLYVHNALDATIHIIDTGSFETRRILPISNLTIPIDILLGAQVFHSADDPRLSAGGWISCANCHFDGGSDGRVWQGFPGGPRNTPTLYGLAETGVYNWSGTWDEVADVELKIRDLQGGQGLIEGQPSAALNSPHAGLSPDLDTLVAYLLALPAPTNPPAAPADVLARGADVFEAQGCAECHVGSTGTNLEPYDVGTGLGSGEQAGTVFDTPSLRWLWLSAPYFHDGSAATLRDVFTLPGKHQLIYDVPPQDIDALVAYLSSLPQAQ